MAVVVNRRVELVILYNEGELMRMTGPVREFQYFFERPLHVVIVVCLVKGTFGTLSFRQVPAQIRQKKAENPGV